MLDHHKIPNQAVVIVGSKVHQVAYCSFLRTRFQGVGWDRDLSASNIQFGGAW